MEITRTVTAATREQWRRWLAKHHGREREVWLVFFKKHTGRPSVPYDDAVEEALCYGWIDSIVKRLDDDRYARRFTPRKPGSKWSESNLRRIALLKARGALAPAGRATLRARKAPRDSPRLDRLPLALARVLDANPKARGLRCYPRVRSSA